MSELNWRTADITLREALVPDPNSPSNLMTSVRQARVAIEGSFLHIDPQGGEEAYPNQGEWKVTIVPAVSVKAIEYTHVPLVPEVY
ncbi:hypothetical protein ABZ890_39610 [Streptomyces sp. NPDC046984]|uniref:hypothetical protein n=1 Tax=Streptomyces sp. NPDC046984 TaxID=3155138 RepID=UPI0033C3CDF6